VTDPRPSPLLRRAATLGATALVLITAAGCARSFYRRSADREAQRLLAEKAADPRWALQDTGIEPGPDSRMFDPNAIDYPPMPADDPASHALMEEVDGKRGPAKWRNPGEPPDESDAWLDVLPRDESGQVRLNLENVVQVGLRNSRIFQAEREELYLSALDVTAERFQFDVRFGLGNVTAYSAAGRLRQNAANPAGRLSVLTDGSVRWLTATGGELLAGLANTLVWNFDGSHFHAAGSVLDFSIVQPLLRLGGRAVTLERLTRAERRLLANVRQMEQYQHGYYIRVTTGRSSGEGPSRGGAVGGGGLGLIAGTPSGSVGAPRADGLLGLLEEQQRIRNLEANIARLRESLDQIEAAFDAGRISNRLQVDQARQSLANSQSALLSTRAAYQTRLDSYKIELGLPPSLPLVVKDPLLERLSLSDPAATALSQDLSEVLAVVRDREAVKTPDAVAEQLRALLRLEEEFLTLAGKTRADLERASENLPVRQEQLVDLSARPELDNLSIERHRFDPARLAAKLGQLEARNGQLFQEVADTFTAVREHEKQLPTLDLETARTELSQLAARLSGLLLALSLDQTATRLETLALPPVAISAEDAVAIARDHRLDWMNARARLVDSWRQIDLASNALLSTLDFTAAGAMGTIGNRSARFDGRTGDLRFGLRFDTPLQRLLERNDYRETLIDYQRARREYDEFEDRVSQSLRNTLRIVELSQLNFELRRSAVQTAISQVDLARLRLDEPPRPGAQAQFGATTARDLVSALGDLLNAQNDLLGLWVGYDVLRVLLDFEMGTMRLTTDGRWIDPGPMTTRAIRARLIPWENRIEGNPKQNPSARVSSR
jgi:outer membrane protein TolC